MADPSIDNPAVHLYFPSFYHHFLAKTPFGFGNDGLLDIRLVVSRDGQHLNYTTTPNGRSPYVPLGDNNCGGAAHAPDTVGGWCSPTSGIEGSHTNVDTSAMYMASGFIPSSDSWGGSDKLYFYASAQPFTHGGDAGRHLWGNNSAIRLLTARRDGFVAVEAPYLFEKNITQQPALTTVLLRVPTDCPAPHTHLVPKTGGEPSTGCSYDYPEDKCPASIPSVACKADADCNSPHIPEAGCCSCHGVRPRCVAGVCVSKGIHGASIFRQCAVFCHAVILERDPDDSDARITPDDSDATILIFWLTAGNKDADLCWTGKSKAENVTVVTGGVELYVNMQTSVVGWVAVEVVGQPDFSLANADKLKGGAINAVASWSSGQTASLSALAGKQVQLKVALADSKLFSLRIGCRDTPDHE